MLIIEGAPHVGKEMFANRISVEIGKMATRVPARESFGKEVSEFKTPADFLKRIKPWTVCNSGYLQELVKSISIGKKSFITPNWEYILEGSVMAVGGLTVLLVAGPESYARLLNIHGKEKDLKEKALKSITFMSCWQQGIEDPGQSRWPSVLFIHAVGLNKKGDPLYASTDDKFINKVAKKYVELQQEFEK